MVLILGIPQKRQKSNTHIQKVKKEKWLNVLKCLQCDSTPGRRKLLMVYDFVDKA